MTSPRVLILTTDQNQPGYTHERMLTRYPKFNKYEFKYAGILQYPAGVSLIFPLREFQEALVMNTRQFSPDYILVHTGEIYSEHPANIIIALLDLEKQYPNLRIGFQVGKQRALGILAYRMEQVENELLDLAEDAKIFTETNEVKELIEQVFMDW